jgi:hypothetical protein
MHEAICILSALNALNLTTVCGLAVQKVWEPRRVPALRLLTLFACYGPGQSQNYLTTDGRSVSLSWCHAAIRDPETNFSFTSLEHIFRRMRVFLVGRSIWREDGSVTYPYNCYLALPALSLGPSPAGLVTASYCLIWGWVPFLSPLTTRRATVAGQVCNLTFPCVLTRTQ